MEPTYTNQYPRVASSHREICEEFLRTIGMPEHSVVSRKAAAALTKLAPAPPQAVALFMALAQDQSDELEQAHEDIAALVTANDPAIPEHARADSVQAALKRHYTRTNPPPQDGVST